MKELRFLHFNDCLLLFLELLARLTHAERLSYLRYYFLFFSILVLLRKYFFHPLKLINCNIEVDWDPNNNTSGSFSVSY